MNNMQIIDRGNLWLSVKYNDKYYMLTYTYGVDATVIFEEVRSEPYTMRIISYFAGGFDMNTKRPDKDILDNAKYYIDNAN